MNAGSSSKGWPALARLDALDWERGWEKPLVFGSGGAGLPETLDLDGLEIPRDAVVFPTSGSTGEPAFVVQTLASLAASANTVNRWLGLGPEDVFFCPLPLGHVGGFGMWMRARCSGGRLVVDDTKWDARNFFRRLEEEAATVISLVPTQVYDLVQTGLPCPSGLRVAVVGGGHLRSDLESEARQLGWPVLGSFGMTETCGQIATERPDLPDPGPDWLPVIDGWEVATHDDGLLMVRGPGLLAGKIECETGQWQLRTGRRHGPWFVTEDRADIREFSGRTWLRPRGRRDDAIKIRGELVSLAAAASEMEGLARGLGIPPASVAVIDQPDPRAGARLVLVGEPPARDRLPVLAELFNRRAPAFARIEHWHVLDSIPRSPLGKLRRSALREQIVREIG